MVGLAAVSAAALVAASVGSYVAFSYLAVAVIVLVLASAAIEQGDSEWDLSPYRGIVGYLTLVFLLGISGIWFLWSPGLETYSYFFGLPQSTFVYLLFIWILPLLAAIYYSFVFDDVAGEHIVSEVIETARRRQRERSYPLAPAQVDDPEATEAADD